MFMFPVEQKKERRSTRLSTFETQERSSQRSFSGTIACGGDICTLGGILRRIEDVSRGETLDTTAAAFGLGGSVDEFHDVHY